MAQVKVVAIESGGDGTARLEVELYRNDGVTPLQDFRRTVVLPATSVLAVTRDANLTQAQKRQGVYQLVRDQITLWQLSEADDALADMSSILPALPISFALKQ